MYALALDEPMGTIHNNIILLLYNKQIVKLYLIAAPSCLIIYRVIILIIYNIINLKYNYYNVENI